MKMIIAILHDDDVENVVQALMSENFRITRVASTGGFFRKGNTTLLAGVDDERVDEAIGMMRKHASTATGDKHGTVFVVPVSRFEQL